MSLLVDWPRVQLGDISTSVSYGYTASAKTIPIGPKFLRITDIVGTLDWSLVPYCEISPENIEKYKLEIGDIVVARTGATTGETYTLKEKVNAVFASYLIRFKINREIADPFFVGYILKSQSWVDFIKSSIGGSAQPGINAKQLSRFLLPLPPLPEQRAIADVLSALDDKIELNRCMNQTLESLAQALFKHTFLDNPDQEGWEEGSLGDVALNIRRSVQASDLNGEDVYIGLEHMPQKSIALGNWGLAEDISSNKFVFKCGEILFGKLRPYFHKVGVAPTDGVCSTDILVITPKVAANFGFVLCILSSIEFVNAVNQASEGTKMPRTNWNYMASYPISIPPNKVAEDFNNLILQLVNKIIYNIHESRTLAELRDTLLPKLMSGQVRVTPSVIASE